MRERATQSEEKLAELITMSWQENELSSYFFIHNCNAATNLCLDRIELTVFLLKTQST